MKNLRELDRYRVELFGSMGNEKSGAFKIYINGRSFFCVASCGGGWEHVSASLKNQKRCPTWDEMCAIKDMFFDPEESVMQLHPAKSQYVNIHPYVLHLWRPIDAQIPLPPREFV